MERLERVNSAYDLEYDYYRKNLPAIDDSDETDESMDLYEKIFDSRDTFTILGLDSYITLSKKSLNKIAKMIKKYPQEYVLFTQHQVVDEDKFDKLFEKEGDKFNPIFIPEQEINNPLIDDDDDFKKVEYYYKRIDSKIFYICLWLYLSLVLFSLVNGLFFILSIKEYGFIFYSIYSLILFICLMFTGIFGFLKCRWKDFSGYLLKISTFLVPAYGLGDIVVYFVKPIFTINIFWIKILIDILTSIVGVILILYLIGKIKPKTKYDDDKRHGLINNEEEP